MSVGEQLPYGFQNAESNADDLFSEDEDEDQSLDTSAEPGVWRVESSNAHVTKEKRRKCVLCKQWCVDGVPHDCTVLAEQQSVFTRLFACTWCGDVFTPLSSMGMHQCRYHPGKYVDNKWTCCGKTKFDVTSRYVHNGLWARQNHTATFPRDPPGCTPCDHYSDDLPSNASAHSREVDIQRDLPFRVLCNFVPGPTERPGWKTKVLVTETDDSGRPKKTRKIGVLLGADACPAEKKRRLNKDYTFKLHDVLKETTTEHTLKYADTFRAAAPVDNVQGMERVLTRERIDGVTLDTPVGTLAQQYGFLDGELFHLFATPTPPEVPAPAEEEVPPLAEPAPAGEETSSENEDSDSAEEEASANSEKEEETSAENKEEREKEDSDPAEEEASANSEEEEETSAENKKEREKEDSNPAEEEEDTLPESQSETSKLAQFLRGLLDA